MQIFNFFLYKFKSNYINELNFLLLILMKSNKKIQEPIKRQFNKINNQNVFNQKIKPKNGYFRENDYRMKNYFNRNDNSNISYKIPKNKITKIKLIKDLNQIQNFGFNDSNPNNQIINTERINKVSNLYQNHKKNKYEIKIENKKIIDDIAQNQKDANKYNQKILNRPKSIIKNNNHYNIINNENNNKRCIRSKSNIININNISKKQPYTKICFNISYSIRYIILIIRIF